MKLQLPTNYLTQPHRWEAPFNVMYKSFVYQQILKNILQQENFNKTLLHLIRMNGIDLTQFSCLLSAGQE